MPVHVPGLLPAMWLKPLDCKVFLTDPANIKIKIRVTTAEGTAETAATGVRVALRR